MSSIDDLVGIPFKMGGRDRAGMDCLGISLAGLEVLDRPQPDPWDTLRRLAVEKRLPSSGDFPPGFTVLEESEPLVAGDILVLEIPGAPAHLAVVIDPRHALTTAKVVGSFVARIDRLPGRIVRRMRPPESLS